ncbi:MAG: helix-turn-helix transcriptional regulator, partial [Verrucomicrobiota bacterium]
GLTYRDVADALELSEASVKRLFSEESFSLRRIEAICRLLDMSLYDLAKMTRAGEGEARNVLSLDQEKALAADGRLLTVFYLLCNGWPLEKIRKIYKIKKLAMTRLLLKLDRLRLIDLEPGEKVRLRTAREIQWRRDGPVRKRYEEQVKQEFFDSDFSGSTELFTLETAELSEASIQIMRRKIDKLVREFHDLAEVDLSMGEREGVGLMIGFRPWVFSLMER